MISSMPNSWAVARFDEINQFGSNIIDSSKFPDEIFELFSVPSFPSGEPELLPGRSIGSTKLIVSLNDVLVCKINPRINRVWMVARRSQYRQIASSEWIGVRAPDLDARYLRYYFSSLAFRELICSEVTGVGGSLTRAQPKRVAAFPVPIAPINEQKRISDKLDTLLARVGSCRERLDRVPLILERFRQTVLAAATSGQLTNISAEVGEKWPVCPLGSLLTDVRYGTAKKCSYDIKGGTPVLRIPNIVNGRVDIMNLKYSHFEEKEIESLSLKQGDLLIIRSNGSLDLVGKAAVVGPEAEGFLYAGYLIRLRVKTSLLTPRYLQLILSSPDVRMHIEMTARSTSGVNNINAEEIRAFKVKLPGIDEQLKIVRLVETLFAFADRLESRYVSGRTKFESITPALLAKAFRGELVSQDPSDEPADKLLERIRSQKSLEKTQQKAK